MLHQPTRSRYLVRSPTLEVKALIPAIEEQEILMEKTFEIYIKTSPEDLWEAITNPEIRARYNFGASV